MENGAPVGREVLHSSLDELAKRIREAVACGNFELARELIEEGSHSGRRRTESKK